MDIGGLLNISETDNCDLKGHHSFSVRLVVCENKVIHLRALDHIWLRVGSLRPWVHLVALSPTPECVLEGPHMVVG